MTALLIFERPVRYVDRGVRYLVEVDGRPQAPRLIAPYTIEVPVEPGEHLVWVSSKQRRYFEARVTIEDGTRRLLLVPGKLFDWDRQPRLLDAATNELLPGTIRDRLEPIEQPDPKHLR